MASSTLPVWHPYKTVTPKAGDLANTLPSSITGTRKYAAFGDSITEFCVIKGGSTDAFKNVGYATWYPALSGNRMITTTGNNLGVAGNTTAQMVARMTDLAALTFDDCLILGGINDLRATQTPSVIMSNLATIINYVTLTLGKRAIVYTIMPSSNWAALTAPQIAQAKADMLLINNWIKSLPAKNIGRILVVDSWLALDDGSNAPIANTTYDGLHLAVYGSYLVGDKTQDTISGIYGTLTPDFTTGNILANGTMTGTAGSVGANFTGSVADSFTASGAGSIINRTASKASGAQRLAMSIALGTATDTMRLSQTISSGFTVGDTVYGMALVQFNGTPSNIIGSSLSLLLTGTSVPFLATVVGMNDDLAGFSGARQPMAETYTTVGQYLIITPDLVISSGSGMSLEWRYEMIADSTVSSSGTIDIISAGVFKR